MIHHQYTVDHVPLLLTERADGWMELELGGDFCEGDEDRDVTFGLAETRQLNWKSGLIVQGIEIRRKVRRPRCQCDGSYRTDPRLPFGFFRRLEHLG